MILDISVVLFPFYSECHDVCNFVVKAIEKCFKKVSMFKDWVSRDRRVKKPEVVIAKFSTLS